MQFPGLTADHLGCYREPKSRSNVYSRTRLEVKEWLLALSPPILERLRSQGHTLDVLASDHHPSLWNRKVVDRQWIFFSRGREQMASLQRIVDRERSLAATLADPTPYFKSSFMSIALGGDGFEAAIKLNWRAWVDRDNFLARMADPQERESLLAALGGLPEEYIFGLVDGPCRAVGDVDDAFFDEVLASFESTQGMLSVGLPVDPQRCVDLGPDLAEVVSVAFLLLAPLFSFVHWTEEEDYISLPEREQAIDLERQAVSEKHRAETEAFESKKRERHEEQQRRFEDELARKKDQQVYRERMRRIVVSSMARDVPRDPEAIVLTPVEAAVAPRPTPDPRPAPAPVAENEPRQADRPRPFDPTPRPRRRQQTVRAVPFEVHVGARVEISSGVLKGKWGIVQQLDRHGQAKIVLGSMVARVPVDQLRAPQR